MKKIKYSRIFYPGYFGIKDGSYFHIYKDKSLIGLITFIKHHIALEMIDLNSKIQNKNNSLLQSKIPTGKERMGFFIDIANLSKVGSNIIEHFPLHNLEDVAFLLNLMPLLRLCKNIHISEFIISQEYKEGDNKNDISIENTILDIFVAKYRELTKDINIKMPSESNWNIFGFVGNEIKDLINSRTNFSSEELFLTNVELKKMSSNHIRFDTREFRKASKPTFDFENTTVALSNELLSKKKVDDYIKLVNKVNEEITFYQNFKYALLEIFMYCEYFVTRYLREKKIIKGISEKKIDENEVSFSYLLSIELPLFLEDYDEEWKSIIGNVNWVRKKRNSVIHNGETVNKEEALKALDSIEKFVNKIREEDSIKV